MQPGAAASTRLTAAALGTVGAFLLYAAYMAVPLAGFLSGLLAPFPVAFVRSRYGFMPALLTFLGATALLSAVFGFTAGIMYLVQCGAISLLMPELLLRNSGGSRAIVWTTALSLLLVAITASGFSMISGQDVLASVRAEIMDSIAQAIVIYEKGGVTGEDLILVKDAMNQAAALALRIYPALVTVMLVAMTGINLSLLRRVALKTGIPLHLGDFRDYRTPYILIWFLIAAGFALLVPIPVVSTPALNLLIVALIAYFFQGMAVAATVISRQSFAGVMRVLLYFMLIFQPYLAVVIAVLGIFDLWGDFRTPRKQENL